MNQTLDRGSLEASWESKYRPQNLEGVIGQDEVVRSLRGLIQSKSRVNSFLLLGGSGVGKTTIARIIAKEYGCSPRGIIELDAASNGGIDDVKAQVEFMNYVPLEGKTKMLIVDECHAVTKQGWQVFLKPIEEPPAHALYAFCTTEVGKVPATIKTRCHTFELKPVLTSTLEQYGALILEMEGINTLPPGALQIIAMESCNSVREMLVNLSKCRYATEIEEVKKLVKSSAVTDEEGAEAQICRLMLRGCKDFSIYLPYIKQISNWSGFRATTRAYISKAAYSANNNDYLKFAIILDCLGSLPMFPNEKDGFADVFMAITRFCKS